MKRSMNPRFQIFVHKTSVSRDEAEVALFVCDDNELEAPSDVQPPPARMIATPAVKVRLKSSFLKKKS